MWKGTNGKSPTLRIQEKIGLDVTVGYRLKWDELSLRFIFRNYFRIFLNLNSSSNVTLKTDWML
jgi:hypothetical protein